MQGDFWIDPWGPGLATELVRRSASTTAIQQAGGWRSPQMVARYASSVAVARHFGGEGGCETADAPRGAGSG